MKSIWHIFKVLSVIIILTAALYGSYVMLRGTEVSMPSLFQRTPGPRLVMSMEGFRFTQSENGRVSWRMRAGSAELYANKEAQLKDLEITFIAPDNKEASLLGESGTLDTDTGNASIRRGIRDVRIVTGDGYLLTTSSLFWKAGERLVRTGDPFKLLGSEIYLEGKGFSADVDMRQLVVNSNVKAVLQE